LKIHILISIQFQSMAAANLNIKSMNKESLVINRAYCPVCRSKERSIIISIKHDSPEFLNFIKFERFYGKSFYDSYYNGPSSELLFEIAECKACNFLYLTEVLNDYGMGLLYNEWLDKELLKPYYANMPYSLYEETMLRVFKKRFRKKDKVNLLDFGAGYGNFCRIATKFGFNTHAFDLSADKNEHMNNMGVTILNNLDKYKGFFDFIYVNQVFEHLSNPGGVLKDLQECLSDDGYIYIATPDVGPAKKTFKKEGLSQTFFEYLSPHQHINGFTNKPLKLLGVNAGLRPLSMSDFLKFYNSSLNSADLKFLIKKTLKSSNFSTALFFTKK